MPEEALKLTAGKQLLLERRLKGALVGSGRKREISPRAQQGPAPLSFAQRQMWLIDQLTPGNPAYNLPVGYRLKGNLNLGALEAGFNEVIKRHETLRTTFALQNGEPVQEIHPSWKIKFNLVPLEPLPPGRREAALQELATAEAVEPFDLSKLPLLRVSLFQLGEMEFVLLINLHHIIADGLSITVLFQELDACYQAYVQGAAPALPALPVQYADFSVWERQEEEASGRKAQLEFWKAQLAGSLPSLDLPPDKPRPPIQSFNGSNVWFDLPSPLYGRLQEMAAIQGVTPFMVILAAFQAVLRQHSGASDIVIGTPIANRSLSEVQPLIGNFLNVVVLRADLSGNPTFRQLLQQARDLTLNAFSHWEVPFEQVIEQLQFQRDPSRNPVFQVMLQVLPRGVVRLGNLEICIFPFDLGFAQFDLSLHLYEMTDGYKGRLEYCSDLFNHRTVERFAGHFLNFLRQAIINPEVPISAVPILSELEKAQLLGDWNNTACDYPHDLCIHQLFEAQALRTPGEIAVVFEDRTLTYAELNQRADRLAAHLRQLGVGPDVPVGLCVERSLDMMVGVLGILKAGGAYVPIDVAYPADRIAYVLEDSKAPVLLTQRRLLPSLPAISAKRVLLGEPLPKSGVPEVAPLVQVRPSNLAYVIYTSGSTGRPKGVMIEHRSVVNRLHWMQRAYPIGRGDVILQKTPYCFDVSVWELFWWALEGATLCLLMPRGEAIPQAIVEAVKRHRVNVMHFVPSMLNVFLEYLDSKPGQVSEALVSLRHIFASGEVLSPVHVRKFNEIIGVNIGARLTNLYGPTETTVDVTYFDCPTRGEIENIPIGKPIQNTRIYILKEGCLAPIGQAGELCVAGVGLARGYLNNPELTNERFVENPVVPGERIYRTGDMARWLPDGNIEYLGREDQQVKIRGLRIELGEIENVIQGYRGVADCVVTTKKYSDSIILIVAYLVCREDTDLKALKQHLQRVLPEYMVPGHFQKISRVPLTANGKADRKALPEPNLRAKTS